MIDPRAKRAGGAARGRSCACGLGDVPDRGGRQPDAVPRMNVYARLSER
jgi:hypothetical protein